MRFEMRQASTAFLLTLLVPNAALAAPPAGYYDSVDPSSQTAIRSSIHATIDDHVKFPYTSSNTDTWNILELADEDPEDSGNILDVYENASYDKVGAGNSNYNREHVWPNSYGFPDDGPSNYPYSDCHMLFLSNIGYNSDRGNLPFGTCAECEELTTQENGGRGGGSGVYPGNSNWWPGPGQSGRFEAWTGRRGDLARALLYADIRYEGGAHGVTGVSEPDLILTDNTALIQTTGGNNASIAYMGLLSTLLAWHAQDPVDDLERQHNEAVASFQGNRNPFVDHPEWVSCAFAGTCSGGDYYTVAPCRLIDTRGPEDVHGGPLLTSGVLRTFAVHEQCGIPETARAVAVNVTATMATAQGNLALFRSDENPPATSTVNFAAGAARANNSILALSAAGEIAVRPFVANTGQVHLVMDVVGYFD
ncbi:MAG TPA: endonuclease [Thermoanaerobaculia bacterium]|nr:endonuclease [Thermoanaerobaculia bacterium]